MQLFKILAFNASIFSLFNELITKYPHPVIIYENKTAVSLQRVNTEIYKILFELDSQWISKSLNYNGPDQHINSLHVFCVDMISIQLVLEKILRQSNTFKIQNLVLLGVNQSIYVTSDIFAKHERLHRNMLICESDMKNSTCWRWGSRNDGKNRTLNDLLYSSLNLNSLKIHISASNSPPNAYTACFSGKFIFTGLDAMVTAEILSTFNATPEYSYKAISRQIERGICNKKDKINDDDALKLIRRLKVVKKTEVQHIFYHTVFDSRLIKYLFYEGAAYDGPIDLNMNTGVVSFNRSMTALLPTEFSCISVVVPRASAASSFIRRTLYNSVESIGFMCTVIVFTIGRILISKSTLKEWFSIFYSTFAVLLSQTILKPRTSGESIVYGLLLVTSIFTTVMLSGLIFTNLINNPSSKTIQTLDDLAASEYKIITQSNIGNWIDQLREDIREKVAVVAYPVIVQQFLTMDKSSALAVDENILALFKDKSDLAYKVDEYYYEIAEKLHCGYFAYHISNDFPLEGDVNQIIQRMVDHGFISAFKNWSLYILKLSNNFLFSPLDKKSPLTLEHTFGVFCLYLVGVGISILVFFCEKIAKLFY